MTFRARWLVALALSFAAAAAAQSPAEEDPPGGREESDLDPEAPAEPEAAAPAAAALRDRPVMVRVGGSLNYDSNFFRAPDPSAERYATAYAGLSIDKRYAQQRIRLDVTETAYRYDRFTYLDFEALDYVGAWDWQLGPRFSGTISATRVQSLVDYSDFRNPGEQNVRTSENFAAGADARLFGGWHLTGALSQVSDRYSVAFPQQGSYRANGGQAGVKWVAPSGNWVALNLRSLDGRYLDRPLDPVAQLDDGFARRESEALAAWRFTGKSSLEGRAAWIDYRSNNFHDRDFSGPAGRLRWLWQAAAKLELNAGLAVETEPWADAGASYRVEQRLSIGGAWQAAARTRLRLEAARWESDYRGPLPGFTGTPRRDTGGNVVFNAEWRALRNLTLNAGAQRYRQSSSDPAANWLGSQFTASASLLF